jgi:hypothetical protein
MKLSQCLRIFELFISMSSFLRYFEQSKQSKLMVGYYPVHIIIDIKIIHGLKQIVTLDSNYLAPHHMALLLCNLTLPQHSAYF